MNITITDKKENIFAGRVEISGKLEFETATPSNNEVINTISKELKTRPDLVVMKKIYTKFSQQEAEFLSFVYKTPDDRNRMEVMTKYLKKKAEEKAKKAAEAAQAAKEAKAVEVAQTAKEAKAVEEKKAEVLNESKEEVKEE